MWIDNMFACDMYQVYEINDDWLIDWLQYYLAYTGNPPITSVMVIATTNSNPQGPCNINTGKTNEL